MVYELRDVNDNFIKEITYKEMMEKLNNHEAGQVKENKRIIGCRLYEPIKTFTCPNLFDVSFIGN